MEIRRGVPLPEAATGPRGSPYAALLERMQPGDSVVLTVKQGHGLKSRAKSVGVPVALRALGGGMVGVWRLAKAEGAEQ